MAALYSCVLDISGDAGRDAGDVGHPDGRDAEDTVVRDTGNEEADTSAGDTGADDPPLDTGIPDGDVEPDMPECDGPMVVYYIDADGDGYGDVGGGVEWCAPPAGFVDNHDDCDDSHPAVHPGQTEFFGVHRGDGSFDYDCDGVETLLDTTETTCDWTRCDGEGWNEGVPGCGGTANWRRCDWWVVWCDVVDGARQQLCR